MQKISASEFFFLFFVVFRDAVIDFLITLKY